MKAWQILNLVTIGMAVYCSMSSQARQSWDEFDPAPLTIVYPEEVALSNPPLIQWQPVDRAVSYRVTLKKQGEATEWTTPFNSYMPEAPLDLGFYSIELAAYDREGNQVGLESQKSFQVKTEGNSFYPRLNSIRFEKGTPMILPEAEFGKLQKDQGERKEYMKKALVHANAPLADELKNLKEPEAYPNEVWNFDLWKKNNGLCFRIEDYLLHQALAYRLSGEKKYLENTRGILKQVVKWNPVGATGVWENDHSAHALLHSLSIVYNQMGKDLPKEEQKKLADCIEARCRDMYGLLNPFVMRMTSSGMMNDPDNNHPWFCTAALGLGAIALMGEVPEAEEWLVFAAQMFNGCYFPRGGSDGGWHEGIQYWSYNLFFVAQFCSALKDAAGIDLFEHPWLQNTAFFKIYTHPPVGAYVPFGDVKHNAPSDYDRAVMMRLASVYGDPLAWKYVDTVETELPESRLYYGVLWSDRNGADAKPLPEIPFAHHFQDIGWVVSNNDPFNADDQVIFALHSGKFFGRRCNHSHADQNHFVIAAGGEKLIWDAGYYDSYLSPHHRYYSRLTLAHNTLLVNGVGQVPYRQGTDGKVTQFELDGKTLITEGDAASCLLVYGGWLGTYLRNIEYRNENEFVIQDDIFCSEYSQVSWLLHSAYPIAWVPGEQTIRIQGEKYQLDGKFETDEPLEATITTKFPVDPDLPANQIFDVASVYPDQYHLEIKTVNKIESWKPKLTLKLSRIEN